MCLCCKWPCHNYGTMAGRCCLCPVEVNILFQPHFYVVFAGQNGTGFLLSVTFQPKFHNWISTFEVFDRSSLCHKLSEIWYSVFGFTSALAFSTMLWEWLLLMLLMVVCKCSLTRLIELSLNGTFHFPSWCWTFPVHSVIFRTVKWRISSRSTSRKSAWKICKNF
jgi:hypothetical protein